MLDHCRNILDLQPLEAKFQAFGWEGVRLDGHDERCVADALSGFKARSPGQAPFFVVAETVKGRGVKSLECDSLCHIKSLKPDAVDALLRGDA
jgi:transketolase